MAARKKAAKKSPSRATRRPRSPKVRRRRKKPEEGEPDRGGRPAIEWTEETAEDVLRLAERGNAVADMAYILGVGKRTLEEAIATHPLIAPAYNLGRANRRDELRAAQYRTAKKGNAVMQIWLGKQELGQRDIKAIEVSGADGGPVAIEHETGTIVKRKLGEFLKSRGKKRPGERRD